MTTDELKQMAEEACNEMGVIDAEQPVAAAFVEVSDR